MIVQTLSTYEVADLLFSDENANWSRAGSLALAEWFEELTDQFNTPQEFDRVAMRCDFSEYRSLREWIQEYYGEKFPDAMKSAGIDLDGTEGGFDIDELIRSHIVDHGYLIEFTGGVIVSDF